MKDIADDLLDDLEELEHSSNQLESSVENVIKNQETLDKLSGESVMESAVFMLEASKLAQDAAINSQQSAEVNLKLAKEQKIQIDELHEANNSWRQAMRNATQEIKGSRGFFVAILITAIITAIITAGLIGGMLFTTNQKNAQFKSELIDLIQTEITLNHRQTTMKIDELASIIELLGSESGRKTSNQFMENGVSQISNPTMVNDNTELKGLQLEAIEKMSMAEIDYDRLQRSVTEALNEQKSLIENWLNQASVLAEKAALPAASTSTIIESSKIDLSAIEAHLEKIDTQLKNQLSQLTIIKKQLDNKAPIKPVAPTSSTVKTPTTDAESDKRQLERDKAINSQLAMMKKQMDLLQAKQEEINKSLTNLTKELEKNLQTNKDANSPYSYRNPYEYKQ